MQLGKYSNLSKNSGVLVVNDIIELTVYKTDTGEYNIIDVIIIIKPKHTNNPNFLFFKNIVLINTLIINNNNIFIIIPIVSFLFQVKLFVI